MSVEDLLTDTVNVQTPTATRDNYGGYEESWANSIVSLPVRIQPLSGSERFAMGKTGANITHRMYCVPPPTAIGEKDRLTFGSRTLKIVTVRDTDEQGRLLVIDCTEESN
jgi:SPP1 family predicted phage head-tail adaptor